MRRYVDKEMKGVSVRRSQLGRRFQPRISLNFSAAIIFLFLVWLLKLGLILGAGHRRLDQPHTPPSHRQQ